MELRAPSPEGARSAGEASTLPRGVRAPPRFRSSSVFINPGHDRSCAFWGCVSAVQVPVWLVPKLKTFLQRLSRRKTVPDAVSPIFIKYVNKQKQWDIILISGCIFKEGQQQPEVILKPCDTVRDYTTCAGLSFRGCAMNKLFAARKAIPPVKASLTLRPKWWFLQSL